MLQIELTEGDCVNGSTGCKMGDAFSLALRGAAQPGQRRWAEPHTPSSRAAAFILPGFGKATGDRTGIFTELVLFLSLNTLSER